MKLRFATLLSIGLFLPCLVWAQEDEPGRGVARISLINGDVSIRRGDSGDWVAAAPNSPLVVYDQVLTGPGSRAEVQFDYANLLRLSSDTEVRIAELENRRYQVQMARGTVMISVLRDSDADFEVDTPNVSVRPVKRGMYRITVTPDGQSEVTVREGEVEAFTPSGVQRLRSGRTMLVRGSAENPEFEMVRATGKDAWDRWNDERDRRLERSNSYQYVSRDIYGADDLDGNGRWINVPPYGWVWSPYGVGTDWAPYRYGRWSWVDYYGWTWVSNDRWGWAPYHYGRWFYGAPYGWCWYPGPIHHRHFWRPALVAFFGFGGGGVNIGVGFGNVGWVPLAPYEPFYPWYGRRYYGGYRNPTFVNNNITIVNNTNIVNVYRNARGGHGMSGIDSGDFVRGRNPRRLQMGDVDLHRASLVRGPVPVSPVADSQRLSDHAARVRGDLRTEPARFYTRRQAPAVERVSFDDQRRGMERMVNRTFGDQGRQANRDVTVNAGRGDGLRPGPAARTEVDRNAVRGGGGSEGWRRVGETQNAPAADRTNPDLRRFGNREMQDTGARGREAMPQVQPNVERERGNANWNRFPSAGAQRDQGGRGREAMPQVQPNVERERGNPNWNRFPSGQDNPGRGSTPRVERTPGEGRIRNEMMQSDGGSGRFGNGRSESAPMVRPEQRSEPRHESPRMERSEPIRINPPIVRERAQPRFEGGGNAGRMSSGGGGAARSESHGSNRESGGRGRR